MVTKEAEGDGGGLSFEGGEVFVGESDLVVRGVL